MTAYGRFFDKAQAGQIADCTTRTIITDHIATPVFTELPFGIAVTKGEINPIGLEPWTTNVPSGGVTSRVFGITVFDQTFIEGKYTAPCPVNVLTNGHIWVTAKIGVSRGDKAYVEEGTGLFTNAATNGDGDNNTLIGIWMSSTGNVTNSLAIISINLEAITLTT